MLLCGSPSGSSTGQVITTSWPGAVVGRVLAAVVLFGFTAVVTTAAAPAGQPPAAATGAWKVEPTPDQDPAGASINLLSAVSCTSGRSCTAVGSRSAGLSSPSFGLAERWNGVKWRIQPITLPKGAAGSELRGVSCTSATACTAVGYAVEKAAHRSVNLAETWNGASWRVQAVPNPEGSTDASLMAVSCTSAKACTAAGFYANAGGQHPVVERSDGSVWRVQVLPKPGTSELYGVSCSAQNACTAVGHSSTGGPLAEGWNGTTWHVQAVPLPREGLLDAVSCTSPRACTATGSSFGTTGPTLAERWNGIRWTVQATPYPTDFRVSTQQLELNGVSCGSVNSCTATGAYAPAGRSAYFLETWNGHSWRLASAPHPAGFRSGALNGVSCASARCTAVGAWSGGPIYIATLAIAD